MLLKVKNQITNTEHFILITALFLLLALSLVVFVNGDYGQRDIAELFLAILVVTALILIARQAWVKKEHQLKKYFARELRNQSVLTKVLEEEVEPEISSVLEIVTEIKTADSLLVEENNHSTKKKADKDQNNLIATKSTNAIPATIRIEDQIWLDNLEEKVQEYLSEFDFTLVRLSTLIYLSPRQIRRRLKQLTGLTFSQYVRQARLTRARQLLVSGEIRSVKQLAYKLGMRDAKYFSQQFKAYFGELPSVYLAA